MLYAGRFTVRKISRGIICGNESLEKMGRSSSKDKLFPYAATVLIIASLTTAYDEIPDDRVVYAGNIYDNIAFLQSIQSDKGEVTQKLRYVCITMGETFRRMICFYQGIFAYGRLKAEFDTESADVCLPKERILAYQRELNNSFLQAARRAAEELAQLDSANPEDVVVLIQRFMDLCKQCSSTSLSYNEQGRYLYTTLGKYEIMDIDAITASIRRHIGTLCKITPENYEKWTEFALEVLGYLQTGSFTGPNPQKGIFQAVHPFVATYSRGNENYDGYRTVTFSLGIDMDADGKYDAKDDVNVLSEFYYTLGEVFYCMPNVLRSNLKWWIDPILISFKEFNDIFNQ